MSKPDNTAVSLRTVSQWVETLRLSSAKQQNLFFKTKEEAFQWEQSLLPR